MKRTVLDAFACLCDAQKIGPVALERSEPVSQSQRGKENMTSNTTPQPDRATIDFATALGSIRHAGLLIHAAWMATASLTDDEQGAARESLQAVLHIAGEGVDDAAAALKRAMVSA